MPKELPPKSAVYAYFDLWEWDGTLERIHHTPGDAVPDANTLWDFREALIAAGAQDGLFCPARPGDHPGGLSPTT